MNWRKCRSEIISTLTFWSNVFFWQHINYFDDTAKFKPLLHTCSLSIEEQFYFLFPRFTMLFYQIQNALYSSTDCVFLYQHHFIFLGCEITSGCNLSPSPNSCLAVIAGHIVRLLPEIRGKQERPRPEDTGIGIMSDHSGYLAFGHLSISSRLKQSVCVTRCGMDDHITATWRFHKTPRIIKHRCGTYRAY